MQTFFETLVKSRKFWKCLWAI